MAIEDFCSFIMEHGTPICEGAGSRTLDGFHCIPVHDGWYLSFMVPVAASDVMTSIFIPNPKRSQ